MLRNDNRKRFVASQLEMETEAEWLNRRNCPRRRLHQRGLGREHLFGQERDRDGYRSTRQSYLSSRETLLRCRGLTRVGRTSREVKLTAHKAIAAYYEESSAEILDEPVLVCQATERSVSCQSTNGATRSWTIAGSCPSSGGSEQT
jgi:hypothetical protein